MADSGIRRDVFRAQLEVNMVQQTGGVAARGLLTQLGDFPHPRS
jgi:hypothetical protein